nr:pyridoxamine 5'-phosphate oxidase family protein [Acidobacteriota bacterium]
ILRLYGAGRSISPKNEEWEQYTPHFDLLTGTRQIMLVTVQSVQTSCGFGVPYYSFEGERPTLVDYSEKMGEEKMQAYRAEKNQKSIDGLPTPALA